MTTSDEHTLTAPPQDLDAERAVLGAVLLSADALADVIEVLQPEHFYKPAHETIYDTCLRLFRNSEPVDAITVSHELRSTGELARSGGAEYLHTLISDVPSTASATFYARIVAEKATLRRLREAATRIMQSTHDGHAASVADVVDAAQGEIYAVTDQRDRSEAEPVAVVLEETLHAIEAKTPDATRGVPTGFRYLDELTGGLRPGQLVVVAARPSVGKSTLGLDFARHAALEAGVTTCFFTLEMDRHELTKRLIASHAGVRLTHLDRSTVTPDEWQRVAKTTPLLARAPLFLDDTANLGLATIRAKARRLRQRHGLGLIVVDYLQLMQADRRTDSRQVEVSDNSRGLKLLAKELSIPVVALAQLNRGVEQRADKRPLLSDMRESGAIEQDADIVLFVHRDDVYDPALRPGEADLIVAKHRNGPTGVVPVAFQPQFSRFCDMPGA